MATAVVLVLALLAPAFSLPFTIPEYSPEIQIEQESPESNKVPQIQPGIEEKTGVQVPSGCSAGYPVAGNQDVVQQVTRVLDAPVNVEQAQVPQTETLFLPPQPAPVTQVDQIVRPVVVPAEAIASGRVIIMAVEPIQQRALPEVVVVPQQQPFASEIPIQQVQSAEKQTPYLENFAQQTVQPNFNEVPQRQSQLQQQSLQQQVHPERQAVEKEVNKPVVQVQAAQGQVVQQVEPVEKQVQSGFDNSPVTHAAEPAQRVQGVDTAEQKHTVQSQSQGNQHQVEPVSHQQVYAAEAVPDLQKQVECAIAQSESELQQRVNVQKANKQPQQSEAEPPQQQTYSVQPEQVVQEIQSVESQQQVQGQVSQVHPVTKTKNQQVSQVHPVTETENQQVRDVPQQVSTFAASQVHNFGDKIPQQQPAETSVQEQDVVKPIVLKGQ